MNRKYVKVICDRSGNGRYIPLQVLSGGKSWMVESVIHSCRSVDGEFAGTRYTVTVCGEEKYLYRDGSDWYIEGGSKR